MRMTLCSKREVDLTNVLAILGALSVGDRPALSRFYCDVESVDAIETELGFPPGRLAIVKREAKQRFFEMRRQPKAKPSTLNGVTPQQQMDWFANEGVEALNELAAKARAKEPASETQNPAV